MSDDNKTRAELIQELNELRVLRDWRPDLIDPAEMYRLIAENAEEALFLYSMEGKAIYVNSAFEKITGYTPQELYQQNFIPYVHPDDITWALKLWEDMLKGEFFDEAEFRIIRKDGEIRWCVSSWKTVYDRDGNKIGLQGRQHDITERKRLEAQIIQTSKLASLGEMATGIAHEINQPLQVIATVVDSHLELSKRGIHKQFDESELEVLADQVNKVGAITSLLRTFGREATNVEYQAYDINEIIQGMVDLFRTQFNNRDIEIEVDLNDLPAVMCNYIQIEQVLLNLTANASDALAAAETKIIRIRTYQSDANVMIEIQDTGSGIPNNLLAKVFDPFLTSKEIGKGTGLGLSICYGIMKDHGGNIRVKETSKRGTTFLLELPL